MTVADRIKERRESLNLTQEELAKRMGYKGKSSVCKIEGSGDNVSLKTIKKVAFALNTTHHYLMGWTEDPEKRTMAKVFAPKEDADMIVEIVERMTIEDELIEAFRELNEVGQEEAIKRVKELSYNPLYTSKNYSVSRDTA